MRCALSATVPFFITVLQSCVSVSMHAHSFVLSFCVRVLDHLHRADDSATKFTVFMTLWYYCSARHCDIVLLALT